MRLWVCWFNILLQFDPTDDKKKEKEGELEKKKKSNDGKSQDVTNGKLQ